MMRTPHSGPHWLTGAAAKMLKMAFVGCGNISSYHLDAIAAADPVRATITALIDPDPARASALAAKVV
eukprot:COSAG04_NODE_25282_length_309_cov_1.238095_2_plen_67_part_01